MLNGGAAAGAAAGRFRTRKPKKTHLFYFGLLFWISRFVKGFIFNTSIRGNVGSKSIVRARRDNGSGVVWNSDGLILTCNHIVRKLDDYEAILNNGRLFQPRNDPYSNIALLKIQSNDDSISLNPIEVLTIMVLKVD